MGGQLCAIFVLLAAAWLVVAGYTSINALVKAELFPTRVRATEVGLPFAIATSIFGGPAESIALWFKSIGHEVWFSYYLSSVMRFRSSWRSRCATRADTPLSTVMNSRSDVRAGSNFPWPAPKLCQRTIVGGSGIFLWKRGYLHKGAGRAFR